MHGTYVHLCLIASLHFNAAEYAMNFRLVISLANEASYHRRWRHPNAVKTMQGTYVSSNTLKADWGGVISHAQRAL